MKEALDALRHRSLVHVIMALEMGPFLWVGGESLFLFFGVFFFSFFFFFSFHWETTRK